MYGFNGLIKHPVHQSIEMAAGTMPLVLLGLPVEVGTALAFCTAIQLLVQHSNVDFRLGPLRMWLAAAEIHRLHHRKEPALGDVNFGLFTTIWDRLLGTLHDRAEGVRLSSSDVGIAARLRECLFRSARTTVSRKLTLARTIRTTGRPAPARPSRVITPFPLGQDR